jgi:hypothetical protein
MAATSLYYYDVLPYRALLPSGSGQELKYASRLVICCCLPASGVHALSSALLFRDKQKDVEATSDYILMYDILTQDE